MVNKTNNSQLVKAAKKHFSIQGIKLTNRLAVELGVGPVKKSRNFNLGSDPLSMLVFCRANRWGQGKKKGIPSKMTGINACMYLFLLAGPGYRKVMFMLRDYDEDKNRTIAEYYIDTYMHLIPEDVEIWEYDPETEVSIKLK